MNIHTFILLILGVIIIGTIYTTYSVNTGNSGETSSLPLQTDTDTRQNQDTAVTAPTEQSVGGEYTEYSEESIQMIAADETALLFFHAAWCPTCRTLDAALQKAEQNNEIPANVTVFKTDFDTERELKKKYQVTRQHTVVALNSDLDSINIWYGTRDPQEIFSQL